MATEVQEIKLYYNAPDSGLNGRVLDWKKKALIRKEARESIKARTDLKEECELLCEQIRRHEVFEAKETINKIIKTTQIGLQEAYDVIFEELLLLKDKLEKDEIFINTHKIELTKDELSYYDAEFLIKTLTTLDEFRVKYIKDVINSIRYNGFAEYLLEKASKKKSSFSNFLERVFVSSLVKKTYKLERKIIKLDEMKLSGRKINAIVKENIKYFQDLDLLLTDMLESNLTLIIIANETVDSIEKAVNEFDITESCREYAEIIRTLQDEEIKALKNLDKSITELENMIKKTRKTISKISWGKEAANA